VRAKRLEIGLSQTGLAEACGITFQQIQKYENGANRVSASRLWQFAAVLGVPVDYFFAGLGKNELPASIAKRIDDETTKLARRIAELEPALKKKLRGMLAAFAAP